MAYYSDLIERIKRDLPIESLLPKEAAGKRSICCPLPDHEDTGPSFTIYRETNSWICWSHPGGQSAGSVLDYLMAERKVEFRAAVEIGAQMLGLEVKPPTEEERQELETWRRREDILTTVARACAGWLQGETEAAQGARAYLEKRGFGRDFQRQHLLGLVEIRKLYDIRPKHPGLAGYEPEEYNELGLRRLNDKGEWRRLFYDTRISIPLMRRQRVVGMTFRSLDPDQRAKYIHLPGPAGLYNEDDLHHRQVVLTEGVPDCWTLMDWGIPAVGNLGVHAVKHARKFKRVETLTLVWDNDEAGRKNVLKTAQAIQSEIQDGEVRILHIPDANDINDWARAGHTAEEFQQLVQQAPPLLEYMIDQLPDVQAGEWLTRDHKELLNQLLLRLAAETGVEQAQWLKRLRTRLDCPVSELRKDMQEAVRVHKDAQKSGSQDKAEGTSAESLKFVFRDKKSFSPALDFDFTGTEPVGHIGVWLEHESNDEIAGEMPCLIESRILEGKPSSKIILYHDRDPGDPKSLNFPERTLPNWSKEPAEEYSLARFLNDPASCTPSTRDLFRDIRHLFEQYIWYPEEHQHDLIAIWVMMTYVYPLFDAIGFLHFHGRHESGKSAGMDLIKLLAFNTSKSDSTSEAAIFRESHANRGTSIYDEAENFTNPEPGSVYFAQKLVLNGSYKKGGMVKRASGDDNQLQSFRTYGPKCLGGTKEIDRVLASRCILVRCLKYDRDGARNFLDWAKTSTELDIRTRKLRNKLHCWALTRFAHLRITMTSDPEVEFPDLTGRERETWLPLFTIARLIDLECKDETQSIVQRLRQTQLQKRKDEEEKNRRTDMDILILQTLLNILEGDSREGLEELQFPHEYQTAKIKDLVHDELVDAGQWPSDFKMTSHKLTSALRKVNVVREEGIRRRRLGTKRYQTLYLKAEAVREALIRVGGEEPEDAGEASGKTSNTASASQTRVVESAAPALGVGTDPPQSQGDIPFDDVPF